METILHYEWKLLYLPHLKYNSMIYTNFLQEIINQQANTIKQSGEGMIRDRISSIHEVDNYALIIAGVRRCGKSTLMRQLIKKTHNDTLYVNFDDPRLYEFDLSDFRKLDNIITNSSMHTLMFDEIQVVKGWERYVRQKLDEGFNVFVTGSNASLLSRELGTSLTGRHITYELYPFSYREFCRFNSTQINALSVKEYMRIGGFPEYVKATHEEIMANLLDDILIRDIAVRYNIKDTRGLRRLTVYLLSNIGNLTSANKLKEPSGLNSTTTILEYISHLESSYLISLVPIFDYSLKKQTINPKKIYAIDMGLVTANVSQLKMNEGHKLENMVYNSLQRDYKEIYYHRNKNEECDFIVVDKGEVVKAIQVCSNLDDDNTKREFGGLIDAMKTYNLTEGYVITLNQHDDFTKDGMKIHVVPSFDFL